MPRRSRAILSDLELASLHEDFFELFSTLSLSKMELKSFMQEFLTEEEQVMISKRFALYKLLYRGWDLFEIQQNLAISRETTRIYSQIKDSRTEFFKRIIERSIKKTNTKNRIEKVVKALKPLEYALDAKTNMKARSKLLTPDID